MMKSATNGGFQKMVTFGSLLYDAMAFPVAETAHSNRWLQVPGVAAPRGTSGPSHRTFGTLFISMAFCTGFGSRPFPRRQIFSQRFVLAVAQHIVGLHQRMDFPSAFVNDRRF